MTGCIYVSPDTIPVLIADCLVTDASSEMRSVITPANDASRPPKVPYSYARLARKIYLAGERTGFAFAGDEQKIKGFLEDVVPLAKEIERMERPMRYVGDRAEDYKAPNGKRSIEVLGACALDSALGLLVHNTAGYYNQRLPFLNQCGAIGSGTKDLIALAQSWASDLEKKQSLHRHPLSTINNFSSFVCSERLNKEFRRAHQTNHSWGGYVEHAYFDPKSKQWTRGSRHIHLFFLVSQVDSATITIGLAEHIVLYDPGEDDGHVLSISFDEDGNQYASEWLLQSLLIDDDPVKRVKGQSYWGGWKCAAASLVISPANIQSDGPIMYVSAGSDDMKEVIFEMDDNGVRFGISDRWMDELGEQYCRPLGLKYVPFRDLKNFSSSINPTQ